MNRRLAPLGPSPHPLADGVPALLREDPVTRAWLAAFDEALAPVFATLDALPAYLDPALTPDDFLDWLAGWVGVLLDENWPVERRRAFVAQAAELYRMRGTARGLAAQVSIFTGGQVDVQDSGAVAWSASSGRTVPGRPGYQLRVVVSGVPAGGVDRARLEGLVATAKPAHVVHVVELAGAGES
jgi:phage tail-like protein